MHQETKAPPSPQRQAPQAPKPPEPPKDITPATDAGGKNETAEKTQAGSKTLDLSNFYKKMELETASRRVGELRRMFGSNRKVRAICLDGASVGMTARDIAAAFQETTEVTKSYPLDLVELFVQGILDAETQKPK
jgi:hypothetical protein